MQYIHNVQLQFHYLYSSTKIDTCKDELKYMWLVSTAYFEFLPWNVTH